MGVLGTPRLRPRSGHVQGYSQKRALPGRCSLRVVRWPATARTPDAVAATGWHLAARRACRQEAEQETVRVLWGLLPVPAKMTLPNDLAMSYGSFPRRAEVLWGETW